MSRKGQASGTTKADIHCSCFTKKAKKVTTNSGFNSRFYLELASMMPIF